MSTIHSVNDVPQITEEIARYTKCDSLSTTRAIVNNKSDSDGGDIVILLTVDVTSLFSSVYVYAF